MPFFLIYIYCPHLTPALQLCEKHVLPKRTDTQTIEWSKHWQSEWEATIKKKKITLKHIISGLREGTAIFEKRGWVEGVKKSLSRRSQQPALSERGGVTLDLASAAAWVPASLPNHNGLRIPPAGSGQPYRFPSPPVSSNQNVPISGARNPTETLALVRGPVAFWETQTGKGGDKRVMLIGSENVLVCAGSWSVERLFLLFSSPALNFPVNWHLSQSSAGSIAISWQIWHI